MFHMFWNSVSLFFKGKLFQDFNKVMMLAGLGMAICAILLIVLAKVGLPIWLSVVITSLIAGGLQPRLFRDLKYR